MSVSIRKSAILFLFATVLTLSAAGASASGRGEYMEWAVSQSSEFDRQWEKIAGPYNLEPVVLENSLPGMTQTAPFDGRPRYYKQAESNMSRVNSSFMNRGNWEFLPRSSRARSGAMRGTSTFKNPARGNHGVGYTRLRPVNSQIDRSSNFAPRGSVSRPRLSRFGRISSSRTRSSSGSHRIGSATRARRRR
jgi:hypothetical protein